MKNLLMLMLFISVLGSVIAYNEKDMKYHEEPFCWYQNPGPDNACACYFKLSDFGIVCYDYKIKIIGFIGGRADGQADIYVTSKEKWNGYFYEPACNPDSWNGAEYGPKHWHINNTYPDYDDCNLYDDNWHYYSKDVDKFWCIYNIKTLSYPYGDDYHLPVDDRINSLTWDPTHHYWMGGIGFLMCNWCMHCVIVYWGVGIENTSLGGVKALFR